MSQGVAAAMLALILAVTIPPVRAEAQQAQSQQAQSQQAQSEEIIRRARTKVQPSYPDLARKMNITGIVKVQVLVTPNGTVKEARIVGGHPVLASAALDAAKKWRFEPSAGETSGVIDFKFDPH